MARPKSDLSRFIESLPTDMPVKQVVLRAKEKGFTTSESNVQRVRYLARKGAKRATGTPPKAAKAAKAAPKAAKAAPKAVATSSDAAFGRLALQIGLDRADELLKSLRTRLLGLVLARGARVPGDGARVHLPLRAAGARRHDPRGLAHGRARVELLAQPAVERRVVDRVLGWRVPRA